MFDNARPGDIITFLQRIDSTVLSGRSAHDAWKEFLKKNGGTGNTVNEMESNWLASKGASSGSGSEHDRCQSYLSSKGFSGSRTDKIHGYLLGSATQ